MSFAGFGLKYRICSILPHCSRSLMNRTALRPIPPPSEKMSSPQDFLKAIGRASETKVSINIWDDFWTTSGRQFREAGVAVKDRKYILWCMEKYRNGVPIKDFAHEATKKKKERGWGPAVQNGKRIRSRRIKNKK